MTNTPETENNGIESADAAQDAHAAAITPAKRQFSKPLLAGVAAAVIVISGAFGVAAIAKDHGDRRGGMPGFMIERMLDRVDATEDQRAKIKTIMDRARDQLADLRGERKAAMEDLTTILKAPTVDRSALETKRAERVAKLEAASKQMTTAIADIADVLTPEQRKIVAALIEDRMDARDDRNGRWMHRGSFEQGGPDAQTPPDVKN